MKKLTRERLKELLSYDPATGIFHWRETGPGRRLDLVAGYEDPKGYIQIRVDGVLYLAHRLSWLYIYGYFPEHGLDHENRNTSDNRIENLREASQTCNLRNTGNRRDNTSGVKGISWYKPYNKWEAYIRINRKRKHLGYHENFNDAVKSRYQEEKALGWSGCDSSSPARKYLKKNNLL